MTLPWIYPDDIDPPEVEEEEFRCDDCNEWAINAYREDYGLWLCDECHALREEIDGAEVWDAYDLERRRL